MDIAALASVMKHSAIQQQVSLSVMKIAMDAAKGQAVDLTADHKGYGIIGKS